MTRPGGRRFTARPVRAKVLRPPDRNFALAQGFESALYDAPGDDGREPVQAARLRRRWQTDFPIGRYHRVREYRWSDRIRRLLPRGFEAEGYKYWGAAAHEAVAVGNRRRRRQGHRCCNRDCSVAAAVAAACCMREAAGTDGASRRADHIGAPGTSRQRRSRLHSRQSPRLGAD